RRPLPWKKCVKWLLDSALIRRPCGRLPTGTGHGQWSEAKPGDFGPLTSATRMKLLELLEDLGRLAHFALRSLLALPAAIAKPGESLRQFYRVLIGSLPISLIAGLAIGLVLWMHVRAVIVRPPGGESALPYLPTALALAVVLEFAPIGAGLIVAGRVGASL